jgi:hypothetical protein
LIPAFARDPSAVAIVGRQVFDHDLLVLAQAERSAPARKRYWKTTAEKAEQERMVLDAVASPAKRYSAKVIIDQHSPAILVEGLKARGSTPWFGLGRASRRSRPTRRSARASTCNGSSPTTNRSS